jgi:hypothetical protein
MIDTSALDEAVRRFPMLVYAKRFSGGEGRPPRGSFIETEIVLAIQREYHLVLAERDRAAARALR